MTHGLRVGIWLDDLRLGVRGGIKRAQTLSAEVLGLDAFGNEVSPRALGESGRRDLAHLLRSSGLALGALRADPGGRRLADAARLDTNLSLLREAFALARSLGAPRVVIPLGFVPGAKEAGAEKTRATLREALKALAIFGQQTGVRPAALAGSEPADDLALFLNEADAAGMAEVDLHPGGLVSRGADVLAALNALTSRVGLATAADFYRGGGEAPFGKGDVPWGEVLVGLSALSRGEPLPILAGCQRECDRGEALRVAVERLRRLRANPLG